MQLWIPSGLRTRAVTEADERDDTSTGPRLRRLPMRVRLLEGDDVEPGSFECIASQYDVEYDIGWGWTEMILPGAFAESIAEHPVIPVFWQHAWSLGPIGQATPDEQSDHLHAIGKLYLDMGDLVTRVYEGMKNKALEEWSVGYWAETILNDKDAPRCDQIVKGDLAEISNVVRGANPDTETIDVRGRRERKDPSPDPKSPSIDRIRSTAGRALRGAV